MSLTKQQKLELRQIAIFACADHEQGIIPYFKTFIPYLKKNGENKTFIIPSFTEIFDRMCDNIVKDGFHSIERCAPANANCIIRVYKRLNYKYDWGIVLNLYGARCYTKLCGKWVTSDGIDIYSIRYDKLAIDLILGPDESLTIDVDFADYYVKVA